MSRLRPFLALVVVLLVLTSCGGDIEIETESEEVYVTTTIEPVPELVDPLRMFGRWVSYVAYVDAAERRMEGAAKSNVRAGQGGSSPGTSPPAAATSYPTSLEPCGGDLPPCWVKQKESDGNYSAVNPTGCGGHSCGGAWQFDPRTWNGYGGYQHAQDAPPDVQDARARELWANGAGCSHWSAC